MRECKDMQSSYQWKADNTIHHGKRGNPNPESSPFFINRNKNLNDGAHIKYIFKKEVLLLLQNSERYQISS